MFPDSRIRRGLRNPPLVARKLNQLYHRRAYLRPYYEAGIDILSADWDNLIILDACRFDYFQKYADLPGSSQQEVSRGSNTIEFLKANFNGRTAHDTVYVTANPQLYRNSDIIDSGFHAVEDIWLGEGWNSEYGTVLPETVVDRTIEAFNNHPNKRLLVHFIQPHYPFLTTDTNFDKKYLENEREGKGDCWTKILCGEVKVPKDVVTEAYTENLKRVLPSVENLLNELPGKTVVTADHGNMFGERARPIPIEEWGHPPGLYTPELIQIPWHVSQKGSRRKIVSESVKGKSSTVDEKIVEDRLSNLGYT